MEPIDNRRFIKRRLMFLCILGVIVTFLIIVVAIVIVTIYNGKSLKQFGVYPILCKVIIIDDGHPHYHSYDNTFTDINPVDSIKPIGARNHSNLKDTQGISGSHLPKKTVSSTQLSSKYIMKVM